MSVHLAEMMQKQVILHRHGRERKLCLSGITFENDFQRLIGALSIPWRIAETIL
jgi:hypothetical protein